MKKRYFILIGVALVIGLLVAGGLVYAHMNHGISNGTVAPSIAAPGDTVTVGFDYKTQHFAGTDPNSPIPGLHSPPNIPWPNDGWRVMLDPDPVEPIPGTTGTMLASGLGPGTHPVDGSIKTYSVSTTVTLPGTLAEGLHTIGAATDVNAGLPGFWGCGQPCHLGAAERLDLTIKVVKKAIIDIKPGSDPNSINPKKSEGVISVAILTTSKADGDPIDFDATQVDPSTVTFGPDGATEVHNQGHLEDVDSDGDTDMVLHFRTQETGIQVGDTEASLEGKTTDGKDFKGTDSIRTVN